MRHGLVLEGGGAKGAWQFGVLQAFADRGIHFDVVCGTSVGALNGAIWSTGRMDIGREMWGSMRFSRVFFWKMLFLPLVPLQLLTRPFYAFFMGYVPEGLKAARFLYPLCALVMLLTPLSAMWVMFWMVFHEPVALTMGITKRQWTLIILVMMSFAFIILGFSENATRRRAGYVWANLFVWTATVEWLALRAFFLKAECGPLCDWPIWLGAIPITAFLISWILRGFNISVLAMKPLEQTIRAVLRNHLQVPLFATRASESGDYFDPDNVEYTGEPRFNGEDGFFVPAPLASLVPTYVRIDLLSDKDAREALLASSALPLGIAPARRTEDGQTLIDGGVIDNTPWFPLIEEFPCDCVVIIHCNADRKWDDVAAEYAWKTRERQQRILQLKFQPPVFATAADFCERPKQTAMVEARDPAYWPTKVVTIAPEQPLGSFLTGTMNFSSKACKERLADGYAAGSRFVDAGILVSSDTNGVPSQSSSS